MTDIVVVYERDALLDAYEMGHDRFADAEIDDPEVFTLDGFKSGATWANHVAPKLRAMAGCADAGHGTYHEGRDVALVPNGAEDDEPAEAVLVDSMRFYDRLVGAFDTGALDAVEDTWDPDSVLH